MQYQGGKSRIAKHIAEIINAIPGRQIQNSLASCGGYFSDEGVMLCQSFLRFLRR